jgi:hypothetical protein
MVQGKHSRNEDFERLTKQGFELRPPVDEYSYQPDSGSTIGGLRGEQEYGIAGGPANDAAPDPQPAAAEREAGVEEVEFSADPLPYGEVSEGFAGVSEWSADQSQSVAREGTEEERRKLEHRKDESIEQELKLKLAGHPELDVSEVKISVKNHAVLLEGRVKQESDKTHVREIVEAIPGVRTVENELRVG